MKRLLSPLLCLLLLAGCTAGQEPGESVSAQPPQGLAGVWVSASAGDLDMVETITLTEDGTITVQCDYQGQDAGTISGVYHVDGERLIAEISQGTTPYTTEFRYTLDGRELILSDSSGDAHYLRND